MRGELKVLKGETGQKATLGRHLDLDQKKSHSLEKGEQNRLLPSAQWGAHNPSSPQQEAN